MSELCGFKCLLVCCLNQQKSLKALTPLMRQMGQDYCFNAKTVKSFIGESSSVLFILALCFMVSTNDSSDHPISVSFIVSLETISNEVSNYQFIDIQTCLFTPFASNKLALSNTRALLCLKISDGKQQNERAKLWSEEISKRYSERKTTLRRTSLTLKPFAMNPQRKL